MKCSNCNVENDTNNKFCYNCGNKLENAKELKKENNSGYQETSLILGIICLVSSFIVNIICFIPGIISIIYAKKYKCESGKLGVGFGLSLAGMIFSFLVLILTVLFFLFIFAMYNETNNEGDYKYNSDYNYEYTVDDEYLDNLSKI